MIRWNKWTKDYTYTYLWHDGVWKLIHRKRNKPIASWFGKMYSMFSQIIESSDRLNNYEAR